MDLNEARILAELHIENHLSGQGWTFEWTRSKRSFGICRHAPKKVIGLSSILTQGEEYAAMEQTILHEIAHAICGPGMKHGKIWKSVARAIGVKNPRATRLHTAKEEDMPTPKWVVVFENKIYKRYYRRPSHNVFASIKTRFIRGRRYETLGKLQIIPYNSYKKGPMPDGSYFI